MSLKEKGYVNTQSSQMINNLETMFSQAHLTKGNEEIPPNFHTKVDLDPELLRKGDRCNLVWVTGSSWSFEWLQGRKGRWQQPHPWCQAHSEFIFPMEFSRRKSSSCDLQSNFKCLNVPTMLLVGNALITLNANQIPLPQLLILRTRRPINSRNCILVS